MKKLILALAFIASMAMVSCSSNGEASVGTADSCLVDSVKVDTCGVVGSTGLTGVTGVAVDTLKK